MLDLLLYFILVLGHTYGQLAERPLLTSAQIFENFINNTVLTGSSREPSQQRGTIVNNAGSTGRNFQGSSFEPGSRRRSTANIHTKGQVTDIHGNAPPPFTETHIDMPGEHCNEGTEPVVHIGSVHDKCQTTATTNVPDQQLALSNNFGSTNNQRGSSNVIVENGIFDAANVHFSPDSQRTVSANFLDLGLNDNMVFNNIPHSSHNNVNTPINSQTVTTDGTNIGLPGQQGNPMDGQHVEHRVEHDGTSSGTSLGHGANELQRNIVGNAHIDLTRTHIDLPGRHGNIETTPVLHRPNPTHPSTEVFRRKRVDQHVVQVQNAGNVGGTHFDLPGQYGAPRDEQPILHRVGHGGTSTDMSQGHGANKLRGQSTANSPIDLGKTHIDLPGQHGNLGNSPVLHRISSAHLSTETSTGRADQQKNVIGNVQVLSRRYHQDRSGQHRKTANKPVEHTNNIVPGHVNPSVVHIQRPTNQQVRLQHVPSHKIRPQYVRTRQVHSQHVPSRQVHSQHVLSQQVHSQLVQNKGTRVDPPAVYGLHLPSRTSVQDLRNIQLPTSTHRVTTAQTAQTGVFRNSRVVKHPLTPNTVRLSRSHRITMGIVPLAPQALLVPPAISDFQPIPGSLGAMLGLPNVEIFHRPLHRRPFPVSPVNVRQIHKGVVEMYISERRGHRGSRRDSRREGVEAMTSRASRATWKKKSTGRLVTRTN